MIVFGREESSSTSLKPIPRPAPLTVVTKFNKVRRSDSRRYLGITWNRTEVDGRRRHCLFWYRKAEVIGRLWKYQMRCDWKRRDREAHIHPFYIHTLGLSPNPLVSCVRHPRYVERASPMLPSSVGHSKHARKLIIDEYSRYLTEIWKLRRDKLIRNDQAELTAGYRSVVSGELSPRPAVMDMVTSDTIVLCEPDSCRYVWDVIITAWARSLSSAVLNWGKGGLLRVALLYTVSIRLSQSWLSQPIIVMSNPRTSMSSKYIEQCLADESSNSYELDSAISDELVLNPMFPSCIWCHWLFLELLTCIPRFTSAVTFAFLASGIPQEVRGRRKIEDWTGHRLSSFS